MGALADVRPSLSDYLQPRGVLELSWTRPAVDVDHPLLAQEVIGAPREAGFKRESLGRARPQKKEKELVMRRKIFAVLIVVSLLTIGGVLWLQPSATEADLKQQSSVSEMINPANGMNLAGSSRLLRSKKEISMTISTTGLTGGNAHSIWWILFNSPENCVAPNECDEADVPVAFGGGADAAHVAEVEFSAVNATGGVVDPDGYGNFSASLNEGAPPAGVQVLIGSGLKDAQNTEVHLLVRMHDTATAGMVGDQISMVNGGCPVSGCVNVQASIHRAP